MESAERVTRHDGSEGKPHRPGAPISRGGRAFAFAIAGRVARAAGKVLVFGVMARLFPVEDVGRFAILVAVGALAGVIADLGLTDHLGRAVPASRFGSSELVHTAARVRLSTLLPATLLAWGAMVALGTAGASTAGAIGAIGYGCATIAIDFVASVQRAHGRYDREAWESALGSFVPLLAAGALVLAVPDASTPTFQLMLGASAMGLAAQRLLALSSPSRDERSDPGRAGLGQLIRAGRWFMAKALVTWATLESTPLLMARLTSVDEVALFASAMRPVGLLTHPFIALAWVFMPALAHDLAGGEPRFHQRILGLNLLSMSMIPAAVAGSLVGGGVLLGLFGEAYVAASPVLLVLTIAYAAYFGTLSGLPVVTVGRERELVLSQVATLLTTWLLLIALVPRHGAHGAALAILGGIGVSKAGLVLLYLRSGLPLGGARQATLAMVVAGWLGASLLLPAPLSFVVLGGGALTSAIACLVLLRRTVLFAGRSTPG
jgi:O-antigen/teichoic acid export membrane protein